MAWWGVERRRALCIAIAALLIWPAAALAATGGSASLSNLVATNAYQSSATDIAYRKRADAELDRLRGQAEQSRRQLADLKQQYRTSAARTDRLEAQVAALEQKAAEAQDAFTHALAERDAEYARQLQTLTESAQGLLDTDAGRRYLELKNSGLIDQADNVILEALKLRDFKRNVERARDYRDVAVQFNDDRLRGLKTTRQVIDLYAEVVASDPTRHWDWIVLGRLYVESGNLPEARKAALRAEQTAVDDRDRVVAAMAQGDIAVMQGDLGAASEAFGRALAILKRHPNPVSVSEPTRHDAAMLYERLGDLAETQGDLGSARSHYLRNNEIVETLLKADPGNADLQRVLHIGYNKLGDVALAQGKPDLAGQYYVKSLDVADHAAAADPDNLAKRRDVSVSYDRLGDLAAEQQDYAVADDYYQRGLLIAEQLAAADPGSADRQSDLAVSYGKIGDMAAARENFAAAGDSYRKAHRIRERLTTADPTNAVLQRDLAVSFNQLGDVALGLGDLAGAGGFYQSGVDIVERLARGDATNAEWQRDLSVGYNHLGDVAKAQGRREAARGYYLKGLEIRERLAAADPTSAQNQRKLWLSWWRIAGLSDDPRDWAKARDLLQAMKDGGTLPAADEKYLSLAIERAKGVAAR